MVITLDNLPGARQRAELARRLRGGNWAQRVYKRYLRPIIFPAYHAELLAEHEAAQVEARRELLNVAFEQGKPWANL